ncbi:hypothetical protein LEP1GSC040_3261 [Leptospira santarosai str. 2000030832]|nr:hypothetical protein LEP1GSC040_3261 [Leptospira santarosai str. 2000030832]
MGTNKGKEIENILTNSANTKEKIFKKTKSSIVKAGNSLWKKIPLLK